MFLIGRRFLQLVFFAEQKPIRNEINSEVRRKRHAFNNLLGTNYHFATYSHSRDRPMNKEQQIKSLACHQIASLIKKGKWVEKLKTEWLRREGMEFPFYKDISGIKEWK